MTLTINGQRRELPALSTVAALVEHLQMKGDRVAIELKGEIVQRGRWGETPLRDGDNLEIVHFVGGGR